MKADAFQTEEYDIKPETIVLIDSFVKADSLESEFTLLYIALETQLNVNTLTYEQNEKLKKDFAKNLGDTISNKIKMLVDKRNLLFHSGTPDQSVTSDDLDLLLQLIRIACLPVQSTTRKKLAEALEEQLSS